MKPVIQKNKDAALKAGEKIKNMDHRDLGSSGFWVSQLFIVLATIIGVYLAANAGLKQAIIFDQITNKERNYYLRVSLHDELQDNVTQLRVYAEDVLPGNLSRTMLENQRPALSQFVWETMRYSPRTLETPSTFLTEGRRFYANVEDIIRKAENGTYGARHAAGLLRDLLDDVEQDLLPAMRENTQRLADELNRHGVDLQGLKETD
ncbi:MAG: hypothetical protein JJU06_21150 [Ectothiorhodospiraceae bacterium]|nr:hypothetical protein [Ectothiorhodospiraceae bacterium]